MPLTEEDELTLHRAERFASLGFGHDESFDLANAKGLDGFNLYWGDVDRMMKSGATQQQIIAIFT